MEHFMTDAEKERFLNRVKIETEDIGKNKNPKEAFIATLDTYQQNMKTQISDLEKLVEVQTYLLNTIQKLYDSASNNLPKDILKTEIATKQQIIMQAKSSIALMRARVDLGESLQTVLINNYTMLNDIDFYFNGVLNMPELESRKAAILSEDKKDVVK